MAMAKSRRLCATALWVSTIVILLSVSCHGNFKYSESEAARYLNNANRWMTEWSQQIVKMDWQWSSNMTKANAIQMFNVHEEFSKVLTRLNRETRKYPWTKYKDPNIRRQFRLFSTLGAAGLTDKKMDRFDKIVWAMKTKFDNATISNYRNRHNRRSSERDVIEIVATSKDEKELKHVWIEWREASGKTLRYLFPEYVSLFNENAMAINYTNAAEFWTKKYEINDFRETMEHLWQQVKPLYQQLFAYVRRRLWLRYGTLVLTRRGPIPAHIIGDLWGQTWETLGKFTLPFSDADVTSPIPDMSEMLRQEFTPDKIFKTAEEFYKSLNFSALPESFWKNSILEDPMDRSVMCHAATWDFQDSKDYRIKQCTTISFKDLLTAHKLIGQMHYAMQYKHQPYIYRNEAFEGLQDAIGEAFGLSVVSADHLHKLGLLPNASRPYKSDINYLYSVALDKVAFLPFAYVMDLWRWNVFDGITSEHEYNCDWWDLRYNYQGLRPPVVRNEADFDPGCKRHITGNVPYIRFFLSSIVQYQIHQALCEKAGQFDPNNPESKPLHECNIYKNTKVGNVLKEMMRLGKSRPWYEAMEILTGTRILDATPLLNYYKPLHQWLAKRNEETGELIGWRTSKRFCIRTK